MAASVAASNGLGYASGSVETPVAASEPAVKKTKQEDELEIRLEFG